MPEKLPISATFLILKNRTVSLRVEIRDPNRRLKPGMFATAEVVTGGASAKGIVIPSSAIQKIEENRRSWSGKTMVLSPRENKISGKEWVAELEVKSGLTEGEQLVVEGSFASSRDCSRERWLKNDGVQMLKDCLVFL